MWISILRGLCEAETISRGATRVHVVSLCLLSRGGDETPCGVSMSLISRGATRLHVVSLCLFFCRGRRCLDVSIISRGFQT
jgi:hypothetical protein